MTFLVLPVQVLEFRTLMKQTHCDEECVHEKCSFGWRLSMHMEVDINVTHMTNTPLPRPLVSAYISKQRLDGGKPWGQG